MPTINDVISAIECGGFSPADLQIILKTAYTAYHGVASIGGGVIVGFDDIENRDTADTDIPQSMTVSGIDGTEFEIGIDSTLPDNVFFAESVIDLPMSIIATVNETRYTFPKQPDGRVEMTIGVNGKSMDTRVVIKESTSGGTSIMFSKHPLIKELDGTG